jgi:hypothetical protein
VTTPSLPLLSAAMAVDMATMIVTTVVMAVTVAVAMVVAFTMVTVAMAAVAMKRYRQQTWQWAQTTIN